ncbi:hypothetical protein LCGC14_3024240 [marine sediment metagenome]|uniref:Uncharacterized protein n=1 Tax=marine sediment metagenome TaxID=412755 RepID=A0A0F8Z218_9ZZZZ
MSKEDYLKSYLFGESYKDILIGFAERSPYSDKNIFIETECFYCGMEGYMGLHTAECIWQRLQYLIEKK